MSISAELGRDAVLLYDSLIARFNSFQPGATPMAVKTAASMSENQVRQASNLFALASDPTRLSVMGLLCAADLHVTAMCEILGVTQPALSHHLSLLRVAGVVESRREGKHVFYSLTDAGRAIVDLAVSLN